MGQSGKSPAQAYRFVDHARYLDAWFDALNLTSNVTLVVHDWGSALGFHRAARYPGQIKASAYMEAIVMPRAWEDFGPAGGIFRALRSPQGEQMILDENAFPKDAAGVVDQHINAFVLLRGCRLWQQPFGRLISRLFFAGSLLLLLEETGRLFNL